MSGRRDGLARASLQGEAGLRSRKGGKKGSGVLWGCWGGRQGPGASATLPGQPCPPRLGEEGSPREGQAAGPSSPLCPGRQQVLESLSVLSLRGAHLDPGKGQHLLCKYMPGTNTKLGGGQAGRTGDRLLPCGMGTPGGFYIGKRQFCPTREKDSAAPGVEGGTPDVRGSRPPWGTGPWGGGERRPARSAQRRPAGGTRGLHVSSSRCLLVPCSFS